MNACKNLSQTSDALDSEKFRLPATLPSPGIISYNCQLKLYLRCLLSSDFSFQSLSLKSITKLAKKTPCQQKKKCENTTLYKNLACPFTCEKDVEFEN